MLSDQVEKNLMTCLVEAIIHTNQVYSRHIKAKRIPDQAQILGEFITSLRRTCSLHMPKKLSSGLESWLVGICKTEVWKHCSGCDYYPYASWGEGSWLANVPLSDGSVFKMNISKAREMTTEAGIRAKYASEKEFEEADLTIRLRDLESGVRSLSANISVAVTLNQEADLVVNNLCTIAEKLAS